MMDSGGQELFEQWQKKQTLMGRTIPVTTAPYSPPKTSPKRNVSRQDRDAASIYGTAMHRAMEAMHRAMEAMQSTVVTVTDDGSTVVTECE